MAPFEHRFAKSGGHDPVAPAVAVDRSGIEFFDLRLPADLLVLQGARVEIGAEGSFRPADVEAAFGDRGVAVGVEGPAHAVGVLEDDDLIIKDIGATVERIDGKRIGPSAVRLLAVGAAPEPVAQRGMGGGEKVGASEAGNLEREGADHPVGQIEIVAALFEQVRSGIFAPTPPVAEDVAAMVEGERFVKFKGDNPSEHAGGDHFLHPLVVLGVAQDEAEDKGLPGGIGSGADGEGVFEGSRQRFFAEDIFACVERADGVAGMVGVPRADHHPIDLGMGEEGFLGIDAFVVVAELLAQFGVGMVERVVDRADIEAPGGGRLKEEPHHGAKSPADADQADGNRFGRRSRCHMAGNVPRFFWIKNGDNDFIFTISGDRERRTPFAPLISPSATASRLAALRAEVEAFGLEVRDPSDFFVGRGVAAAPNFPGNMICFSRGPQDGHGIYHVSQHHRCVLLISLEGSGTVCIDDGNFLLAPGEAILIFPFAFHTYMDISLERYHWLFMTFEIGNPDALEPMRSAAARPLGEVEWMLLAELAQCWRQESRHPLLSVHLGLLLARLAEQCQQPRERKLSSYREGAHAQLLREINHYLLPRLHEPLTLGQIARALGESESYLRARFREATGRSLGRHLRNLRLERACSLLHTTTLSITEIAIRSGYESLFVFSRAFKARYGRSPRAYRDGW